MSSFRMTVLHTLRGAGIAALASVATAHAGVVTGKYFDVEVNSVNLPTALWDAKIVDALDGLSTSLIIKPLVEGLVPSGVWSQRVVLSNLVFHGPQDRINLGTGLAEQAQATLAGWTFQAQGVFTPPADASFKTAYGSNQLTSHGLFGFFGDSQVAATPSDGTQVLTLSDRMGTVPDAYDDFAEGIGGSFLNVSHQLYTPYYALPSISNPRCDSLSCMQFKEGSYSTPTYTFTLQLNALSAVPEPDVWMLLIAGGMGLYAMASRRSVKKV